jgi:Flagellar hook-length control protein FliK
MDLSAIQSDLTRLSVLRIDGTEALTLAIGQEFTARIVRIETEGQLLLSLGGKRFYARTELPLQEGQEIRLQVAQTGPPIELRLVPERIDPSVQDVQLAALLVALRQGSKTGEALGPERFLQELQQLIRNRGTELNETQRTQLEKLLLPLAVGPRSEETAVALRNLLENSGLFFEAKLRVLLETLKRTPDSALKDLSADLKTLLGRIGKALEMTEPLSNSIDKSLIYQQRTILSEQLLSRQAEVAWQWLKDGSFLAEFPLLFFSEPARARVRFFARSNKPSARDQHSPYSVDIFLDLPQVGRMEAWAQWLDGQIEVRLYVETPKIQQEFTAQLTSLVEALEKAGFERVNPEVRTDPVRLYRADWQNPEPVVEEGSVLNIRA